MSYSFENPAAATATANEYLKDLYKMLDKAEKADSEREAQYTRYYEQAKAGDTSKIPTEALKNMSSDPACAYGPFMNIAKELASRGEKVDSAAAVAQSNNQMYKDYYRKASQGDTKDTPTYALQNMAMDPKCSDAAYNAIARELKSRNEPIDRNKAEAERIDKLYTEYYKKATSGDVKDIPTEALQNMGMDPNCSRKAYKNIADELNTRGEPVNRVDNNSNEALYTRYYEMACNGEVATIPTDALKNMASDPKCSALAYNNIVEELNYRDEPLDDDEDNSLV